MQVISTGMVGTTVRSSSFAAPARVLTDLRMPGLGGLARIEEVAEHHPGTAVVVLTTYDTPVSRSSDTACNGRRPSRISRPVCSAVDVTPQRGERLLRTRGLADHHQIGLAGQLAAEPVADYGVIVDQEHVDRLSRHEPASARRGTARPG